MGRQWKDIAAGPRGGRRGDWPTRDDVDRAVRLADGNVAQAQRDLVAAGFSCTYGTVRRIAKGLRLKPRGHQTQARFAYAPVETKGARLPPVGHPALAEKRTIYPMTVADPARRGDEPLLKRGEWSSKIGGAVLKGRWRGWPIYVLNLEERATCPTSCVHWRSCYGNKMHLARRWRHGAALEAALAREVAVLAGQNHRGFVVRLHGLGDFYSTGYVALWAGMIDKYPALHAFGYTARWDAARDPIARALVELVLKRWDRFAVRFFDAPVDECATVSIEHPLQRPPDAIVCPQQTGGTESCATCALCWSTRRRIAFIQH